MGLHDGMLCNLFLVFFLERKIRSRPPRQGGLRRGQNIFLIKNDHRLSRNFHQIFFLSGALETL